MSENLKYYCNLLNMKYEYGYEYGIQFNYCKACIYEIMYIINICAIMYLNNYAVAYNICVKFKC